MLWGSIVTIQKKNLKINRNNNSHQQEPLLPIAMMACKLVENAITQTENNKVTAQGHAASKHRGYQPAHEVQLKGWYSFPHIKLPGRGLS